MTTPLLSTENLQIGYSRTNHKNVIAANLNLKLYAGKLIALVGTNGIGKSTLLRTLTGIQEPLSGAVFINSKKLNALKEAEIATQLSVVLTEKLPPSNLTVYELIALGRQPYTNWIGKLTASDKTCIESAIEWTNCSDLVNKKHFEISDGQFQKVLVARALAQDTPLIILDEPTTHLDLEHKVSLFKLLHQLSKEKNKSILFSTHDIDLAIQIADEMIVMTKNQVVQDEPCQLISSGIFDWLFDSKNITFDSNKGKFIIV